MRPRLVLVGPPGAGKTTVGRLVAQRLQVPFRDTDQDVERAAGKPISEIFIDDGEQHFRALERDAVARALREHDGVLSLGGGAVLAVETRQALAGHTVVFLDVDVAHATARVGMNRERPVLALNPRATLMALLAERLPLYRAVASLEVATGGRSPEDVADEIVRRSA
jgi:shikimate kinase